MNSKQQHPPKYLQGILWSCDVNKLDIEQNKTYIIHQLLAYGNISQWRWLFDTYPADRIQNVFLTKPYKDYRAPRFNLIANYLLDVGNYNPNPARYVKNIPRDIRPRT
ncbi:hypothetical protein CO051_01550 [Candidatus Roizmanbacteria bacterium CG_4_9_14_0_2_um_filter_39_13]|uniref:DUF6922 domain-containing protein n=1 Tax=Candidatus Roizmanbacteria bacterium CG_4_9_14_0_2_um_filter_39_13 TaxID=1974839 RepID=A0A2M8F270_9BACT|nr:MAG: hypothetical protein COY15_03255 [Candidatus Roizmanbacteria bacterium CG_4_10_14_0_2_um_filter_39_12]PJC33393.1 MAG: hypothetical protein CO051_01550 [Candidatus Roizmanbacteria bacterium CG_4_9_14_0_2_um_filter_39_13]